MDKVDYKIELKELYSPTTEQPQVIDAPAMNFIMIDGRGDPNNAMEYTSAIEALYPVAYTIKFMLKKETGQDFAVMPLEGLWWAEDMSTFTQQDKSNWLWTAMIMQPEIVTQDLYDRAVKLVSTKKNPSALPKVRFESYVEGRAAQVLYTGPYSDEGPTIQRLHEFIREQGGTIDEHNKHHHEIYLSDSRRTVPTKLKTIIRQPY